MIKLDRWPEMRRKKPYGRIKIGYKVDENDPYLVLPDTDKVKWIEEAFDLIENGHSLRECVEWLQEKILTHVAPQSLSNMYDRHRKPWVNYKTKKRKGPKLGAVARKKRALKSHISKHQAELNRIQDRERQKELEKAEDKGEVKEYQFENMPEKVNIIFKPNPGPQTEFLRSSETEVLYGGAAGGGKSYALLADPMRYFDNSNFNGLLLRRTNDELRELIWKSQELYPKLFKGAKWREKEKEWRFPSGARLWMTYLEKDEDVMRYQGQAFTWIAFDELTQYPTPFAWNYLRSRLRSADQTIPLCMRATTNPGGPGHHWVKRMFVDPEIPGKAFNAVDIATGEVLVHPEKYPPGHPQAGKPNPKGGQPLFKRKFIPASLYDNPYLIQDDNYESSLLSLPEAQRRKLLEGDWTIVEGAAFPEFSMQIHVCEPFDVPPYWRKFRAADYGYSSHSGVLWFAIEPGTECLYIYRELYTSKKTAKDLASIVLEMEDRESMSYGMLDSSVWHQRGHNGPSIAEEMIAEGCKWRPSDRTKGSRTAGKNRLHELLKVDEFTGKPGLVVFNTCRNLIAQLPMIPSHPDGVDDIDDKFPEDHLYDALRYGIMSRPRSTSIFGGDSRSYTTYSPSDATFGY